MRDGTELEQLCCLGLPGEVLVPELLARLHDDVRSHWNIFFWFDAQGEIVNAYGESPQFYETLPHYFTEFYHRGEYELMGRGTHAMFMRDPAPVEDLRGVVRDDRKVARSGFFQEILHRGSGFHNVTYLKVRDAGRPLAMVLLGTGDAKPEIDAAERERLTRLAPFIAHGLAAPKSLALHEFEDDDSGVMVFDRAGTLQHVSPSARMLLFLATHPQAGPRQLERPDRARLDVPEPVRRLCADLGSALGGGESRSAPTHLIENRWGRFAFRAYPLDPVRRDNALTGVIIQRQIPLALALWRRIRELGLPSKQAQVCLHLASGSAYADIAKEMNVSINTVTWHVREIYARFDVHSASELSRTLLNRPALS